MSNDRAQMPPCPTCRGHRVLPTGGQCPTCKGAGKLFCDRCHRDLVGMVGFRPRVTADGEVFCYNCSQNLPQ